MRSVSYRARAGDFEQHSAGWLVGQSAERRPDLGRSRTLSSRSLMTARVVRRPVVCI